VTGGLTPAIWDTRRRAKSQRVRAGSANADGKVIRPAELKDALHAVIRPGDRVALEGDNRSRRYGSA
jgi:malonate decarboxylase alpha subunit